MAVAFARIVVAQTQYINGLAVLPKEQRPREGLRSSDEKRWGLTHNTTRVSSHAWLKTGPTADAAGCSERTLKRNMDVRGGCLNLGEHYRHGPSANSSYSANAEVVIEALAHRGLVAAKGRELLLELTASEQKN